MSKPPKQPATELFVHCQGELNDQEMSWIAERIEPALQEILASYPNSDLEGLPELELSLVDDATLAEVHGDFMDDPTPTDVITFPHGEILVSVEMAAQRAQEFGKEIKGETLLYLVHGMLHLAGLDDRTPEDAARMAREQERVGEKLT